MKKNTHTGANIFIWEDAPGIRTSENDLLLSYCQQLFITPRFSSALTCKTNTHNYHKSALVLKK